MLSSIACDDVVHCGDDAFYDDDDDADAYDNDDDSY